MLPLRPDMASLATGSCNFPTRVYENPPDLVDWLAAEMLAHGVKPEIEAFDLSMIFKAVEMERAGKIKGPLPRPVRHGREERDAGRPRGVRVLRRDAQAAGARRHLDRGRHRQGPAHAQPLVAGAGRPLPHRARGQRALDKDTLAPSNAALVAAWPSSARVRPAAGDRGRGALAPAAAGRRREVAALGTGIFGPLLGDAEVAAILGDAAQAGHGRVERALAEVEGGSASSTGGGRGDRCRRLPVSRPTSRTSPAAPPRPACRCRPWWPSCAARSAARPAGFVHWGATSQDIVDTALVLQLREALALLEGRLAGLIARWPASPTRTAAPRVARTRFQQARCRPPSGSRRRAGWRRCRATASGLAELKPRLLVVQFGGAAGNLSALGGRGVEVMEALARELGLGCPPMPWHNQRDAWPSSPAGWRWSRARSASSARTCSCWRRTRSARCARPKAAARRPCRRSRTRSSAEALVALARRNATLVGGMHQAMLHAQERDGAAWQLEWAILPDMVEATAAALAHARELARTLVVDAARMRAVLDAARGLPLAEPRASPSPAPAAGRGAGAGQAGFPGGASRPARI